MLDLLYLSRTVVPAHLSELEQLDVLYRDEQVLVALDGVLLDDGGSRLSGPTLHDYCVLTGNRVLLWARDYAEHTCYAFPLHELHEVAGHGLDPLHAQLHMTFCSEGEAAQRVTLSLLPLVDLPMALALLEAAAAAARQLHADGVAAVDAGGEVAARLSATLYGDAEAPVAQQQRLRGLSAPPYRWQPSGSAASPGPATSSHEAAPEMVYTLGRLGRSAWDTLARSLRENDLPFDVSGANLRDLTSLMQAANDLLGTISGSAEARATVAELFGGLGGSTVPEPQHEPLQPSSYREIPLRRQRNTAAAAGEAEQRQAVPVQTSDDLADLRGIPLRRRARGA